MSIQTPHLTTAASGPLQHLERYILSNQARIEDWLRKQWRATPAPLYGSVDLRNAGFKLAPVDTNLFPAGFNNLNPDFLPLCIQAMQSALESSYPGCRRLLLIPESHTRNLHYFESIAVLSDIIQKAGYEIRIGSLLPDLNKAKLINLPSGKNIYLEPVIRQGDRLGVADFSACVIILNHDLSGEIPALLQGITQAINPPLALGWATRLKSMHFKHYQAVAEEFAQLIDIDPWLINPLFTQSSDVNFLQKQGEAELIEKTESLLQAVQNKYREYGIEHKPYVVIKADAGTYGMGVMMVQSAEEIRRLNRKERTRMSTAKGNQQIDKVIIQEGVYTFETWGEENAVAEPVVYMIGQHVVGGFYRVHTKRGINENLNSPGMHFEPLAFAQSCNFPCFDADIDSCSNRFYAYGVIARLALVAAAREKAAI